MSVRQLPPDELSWILKLNATQAEQELHKYTKEQQKSREEDERLRAELKKTEYEYGARSAQAKALRSELKVNNEQIRRQKEIIKELNKQLSIEDLSMNQLRHRYLDLEAV